MSNSDITQSEYVLKVTTFHNFSEYVTNYTSFSTLAISNYTANLTALNAQHLQLHLLLNTQVIVPISFTRGGFGVWSK